MRFSTTLLPVLSAVALAAPQFPVLNVQGAIPDDGLVTLSEYFNLLVQKIQANKAMSNAPVCDLKNAKMAVASPEPLPEPAEGHTVKHVAIGRGIQNYTCDANNATAPPKAFGAEAVLFDASCIAAMYPDLLDLLPRVALSFNFSDSDVLPNAQRPDTRMGPSNLAVSGVHYFDSDKVPFFNLTTARADIGEVGVAKNASVPAPNDASPGQQGEPAVAWLKLVKTTATGGLQEVYRLGTAGGSPPKTCEGMPEIFQVAYAAQYWFFQGPDGDEDDASTTS